MIFSFDFLFGKNQIRFIQKNREIFYFTVGTGRSKPYIDRKHFFQELKNPPKKPLKELASTNTNSQLASSDPPAFQTGYQSLPTTQPVLPPTTASGTVPSQGDFTVDPFGEDPFVKEDPFADFSKQDPFETEFANFASSQNNLDQFKFKVS